MGVDLEKAKKIWNDYVQRYNQNQTIEIKIGHCLRVMENSKKLAENLSLSQEEIEVATLIGLLHDIGRFEERGGTLPIHLNNIDHGDFGTQILKQNDFLRQFISDIDYDSCIYAAIRNHSKYQIEEGLTEKELLFSKIIRDADKLDIFYEVIEIYLEENKESVKNGSLSEEMEQKFKAYHPIQKENKETRKKGPDYVIFMLTFLFGINFKVSFDMIKTEKYIDRFVDGFTYIDEKTKQKMEEIKRLANQYIEEKIKEKENE